MPEKLPSLNQRYTDIASTLATMSDMVARIDERVDIFIGKLKEVDTNLSHHIETCPVKCSFSDVVSRVSVIESKNGKVLREELLAKVEDNKQTLLAKIEEQKIMVKELDTKSDTMKDQITTLQNTVGKHSGHLTWVSQFLFNAAFNIIAIVVAAYLLHLWKVVP
jgi:hypothetical protein